MAKFIVKATATGTKFDLKDEKDEKVMTSEVYSTKAACLNGVESVKKNSAVANVEDQTVEGFEVLKNPKFEIYNDKAGAIRFRLKATNGQIIAVSDPYHCINCTKEAIESIKACAKDAEVVEE